jgi:hypothetical protein
LLAVVSKNAASAHETESIGEAMCFARLGYFPKQDGHATISLGCWIEPLLAQHYRPPQTSGSFYHSMISSVFVVLMRSNRYAKHHQPKEV